LSREHGPDRQHSGYLSRLEDAAVWIDERNPLAAELEAGREICRVENAVSHDGKPAYMVKSCLPELRVTGGAVHRFTFGYDR